MQKIFRRLCALLLVALVSSSLAGCGGYANAPSSKSGVETYGVIDVGVGSTW